MEFPVNTLRNLVLAGTVAVAAVLSAGIVSAAPSGLGIDAQPATQNAATPLFQEDLCRLPYYQLVHRFGSVRARKIILRCNG